MKLVVVVRCSDKDLSKPCGGRRMNPPDLWIHGPVADADKMTNDDDDDGGRHTARSDRLGLFTCYSLMYLSRSCLFIIHCLGIVSFINFPYCRALDSGSILNNKLAIV